MPSKVLLRLLDPKRQGTIIEPNRGQECEHDLHVLRSYYAIRAVINSLLSGTKLEEWSSAPAELFQLTVADAKVKNRSSWF